MNEQEASPHAQTPHARLQGRRPDEGKLLATPDAAQVLNGDLPTTAPERLQAIDKRGGIRG